MVYIALASAVSYAAPVQVLEYFAPAPVTYYALLRLQQGVSILSLSCPPSTLALVVEYIAPAPAVYAAPPPVVVYIAPAQAVSWAAPAQVLDYLAPAFSASAGPFATATGSFNSLPVVPTVYTCTCGGVHRAGTSSVTAPAPVMVYIALAQAVSYAAPAQVLVHFAPAPVAYAAHIATTTSGFGSLPVVPTSSPAPVVQYIAPTPGEYAAPAPVMSTSRQHNSFLRRASSNT